MFDITFSEALEKAKLRIIKKYERRNTTKRAWLEAHIDSYHSEYNRLQMIVLEGSPPKGFIIVNYGANTLTAFDCHGNKLHVWTNLYDNDIRKTTNK